MSLTHYSNKFLFCFFRATADGSLVFFLPSHYYYYLLRKESRPCFRNSSRFAESTERKGDAYTENGRIFFPYFGGDRVLYKIVHTQPKVFHKSCANLPGDTHKLQGEMKGGKNKKLWTWKVVRKYNRRWIVPFFLLGLFHPKFEVRWAIVRGLELLLQQTKEEMGIPPPMELTYSRQQISTQVRGNNKPALIWPEFTSHNTSSVAIRIPARALWPEKTWKEKKVEE